MASEGSSKGMTMEQRLTERAKKENGSVSWYVNMNEAMEKLVEYLESPTVVKASEDDEFMIRVLATQYYQRVKSMDEVGGLIYMKDKYNWRGEAFLRDHDGVMGLKDALAEIGIPSLIYSPI